MLVAFRSCIPLRKIPPHRLRALKTPYFSHPRGFTTTNVRNKQLKDVLFSITNALRDPKGPENVQQLVHKQLDEHLPEAPAPHAVYEQVISLLIDERFFGEASSVYERMLEDGLLSSGDTDAKMLAIMFAKSEGPAMEQLLVGVKLLFQNPDFSEDDVVHLLRLMIKLDVAPETLLAVIEQFMNTRKEDYIPDQKLVTRLVDAQARSGFIDEAIDTLNRFGKKDKIDEIKMKEAERRRMSKEAAQYPYAALIAAIRKTRDWDGESLMRVLDIMQSADIKPGIPIFNNIISAEVHTRSLQYAFSLYRLVKNLAKEGIEPDAFTFSNLFKALGQMYSPRVGEARRHRRVNNVPPPRLLYYDMMTTLGRPKPPNPSKKPKAFPSALDVALRAFLHKHDYPGAFVVLSTFRAHHLPIEAITYNTVMRHLMFRLQNDLKSMRHLDEIRWGDYFLGLKTPVRIPPLTRLVVDNRMLEHILAVVKQPSYGLTCPFYIIGPEEITPVPEIVVEPKYITPTVDMMNQEKPMPLDVHFSHVPLERILRRMIFSSCQSSEEIAASSREFGLKWKKFVKRKKKQAIGPDNVALLPNPVISRKRSPRIIGPLRPAATVSEAIADAKEEMLPGYE